MAHDVQTNSISMTTGTPKTLLLSKSTFVAAYDCPVRLLHNRNKMASTKQEDDFLKLLAEGGMQFECLVRLAYDGHEFKRNYADPHGCHAESIAKLEEVIDAGTGILHEPTFVAGPYTARVDMLRITGNRIELCEIKAKSFAGPAGGWDGNTLVSCDLKDEEKDTYQIMGKNGGVLSSWIPYIADVAFQLNVLERTLIEAGHNPDDFDIVPALVLVNKHACCTQADTRSNVHVLADDRSVPISDRRMKDWHFATPPKKGWRSPLIVIVDVSDAVGQLRKQNAKSKAARWKGATLDDMMDDAARIYCKGEIVDPCTERGWKCRDCEYNGNGDNTDGFNVCWGSGAASARNLTHLYHGSSYADPEGGKDGRWVHLRVDTNLTGEALTVADLDEEPREGARALRRSNQIRAERSGTPVIGEGLKQAVQDHLRPRTDEAILWFIDFETSLSCLPHYVGDRPYQVVPFQFSCHAVPVRGGQPQWDETKHREWLFDHNADMTSLCMDRTFTDELMRAVTDPVNGISDPESPIFHWSAHERTVLKAVRKRLQRSNDGVDDSVRIASLGKLVGQGERGIGRRLSDMLTVADANVFHHLQKGRFSIKQFLPAICAESDIRMLASALVPEAKDDGSVPEGQAWDPYKGLPTVGKTLGGDYRDVAIEEDASVAFDGDTMSSGTDAMRAFASLRYGADGTGRTWSETEKKQLQKALLVYCRLDTAAMVAVWRWLDGQV